jgi:hypothetical protein
MPQSVDGKQDFEHREQDAIGEEAKTEAPDAADNRIHVTEEQVSTMASEHMANVL